MDNYVEKQRIAFDEARIKQYSKSTQCMQDAVNLAQDERTRGFLKQQLAEYTYYVDKTEAQKLLISALNLNNRVLKPIAGIEYKRLGTPESQSLGAFKFMEQFPDGNDLILWLNDLLDNLQWDPLATKRFEHAVHEIGRFIGFFAQRPEQETHKGPDNLWGVGAHRYFVIECKSGAIADAISKTDCNQLLGSVSWFKQNYPPANSAVPILIHPKFKFMPDASPAPDFRIVDNLKLVELRDALKALAIALGSSNKYRDRDEVGSAIASGGLLEADFVARFTRVYSH